MMREGDGESVYCFICSKLYAFEPEGTECHRTDEGERPLGLGDTRCWTLAMCWKAGLVVWVRRHARQIPEEARVAAVRNEEVIFAVLVVRMKLGCRNSISKRCRSHHVSRV